MLDQDQIRPPIAYVNLSLIHPQYNQNAIHRAMAILQTHRPITNNTPAQIAIHQITNRVIITMTMIEKTDDRDITATTKMNNTHREIEEIAVTDTVDKSGIIEMTGMTDQGMITDILAMIDPIDMTEIMIEEITMDTVITKETETAGIHPINTTTIITTTTTTNKTIILVAVAEAEVADMHVADFKVAEEEALAEVVVVVAGAEVEGVEE